MVVFARAMICIGVLAFGESTGHAAESCPPYPKVGGDWICTDKCSPIGGIAKITQNGGKLALINEHNEGGDGFFENCTTIRVSNWQSGLRGNLSENNKVIGWANGTVWRRQE
ncbi:hypothetical protein I6F26_10165 [Ensifer sp. IC3342]|nr:hypothetical protein [Ensifer sp. BRP08]MCA1446943.1 hypothetical protein [Ensifer sp. IC3342]